MFLVLSLSNTTLEARAQSTALADFADRMTCQKFTAIEPSFAEAGSRAWKANNPPHLIRRNPIDMRLQILWSSAVG